MSAVRAGCLADHFIMEKDKFNRPGMTKEKAKDYFLGRQGCLKLNCCQSVIAAFKDKLDLPENLISECGAYGSGKAPEGYCGAFYAAKKILESRYPEVLRQCEIAFLADAGSVKCKGIRSAHKMSCVECVEKASAFINSLSL